MTWHHHSPPPPLYSIQVMPASCKVTIVATFIVFFLLLLTDSEQKPQELNFTCRLKICSRHHSICHSISSVWLGSFYFVSARGRFLGSTFFIGCWYAGCSFVFIHICGHQNELIYSCTYSSVKYSMLSPR